MIACFESTSTYNSKCFSFVHEKPENINLNKSTCNYVKFFGSSYRPNQIRIHCRLQTVQYLHYLFQHAHAISIVENSIRVGCSGNTKMTLSKGKLALNYISSLLAFSNCYCFYSVIFWWQFDCVCVITCCVSKDMDGITIAHYTCYIYYIYFSFTSLMRKIGWEFFVYKFHFIW